MDLDSSQQTKQEHTEAKRRILACAWATATAAPTATDRDDLDIDAFAPPPLFLSLSLSTSLWSSLPFLLSMYNNDCYGNSRFSKLSTLWYLCRCVLRTVSSPLKFGSTGLGNSANRWTEQWLRQRVFLLNTGYCTHVRAAADATLLFFEQREYRSMWKNRSYDSYLRKCVHMHVWGTHSSEASTGQASLTTSM